MSKTPQKYHYGATKLVMINSGTVDYIELDLTLPLHLSAVNNLGKTSIVNTLQFLYIDDMRDMFMPSSTSDSVNFYFRDEYSYVVFEATSKIGTFCIVLNRPSETRHRYHRYFIPSAFDRDLFTDAQGNIRDWTETTDQLAERQIDSCKISNRDLWLALSGLTDRSRHDIPALFILPVTNRESYRRFKMVYRDLLSMSSLKLESFKDLMLACAEIEGYTRSIDFVEKGYHESFDKCRKLQLEFDVFCRHENKIRKIVEEEQELKQLVKQLQKRLPSLSKSYQFHTVDLSNREQSVREHLTELAEQIMETTPKLQDISRQQGITQERQQGILARLSELKKLEDDGEVTWWLANGGLKAIEAQLEKTQRSLFGLEHQLENVQDINSQQLEKSISRLEIEIESRKRLLGEKAQSFLHFLLDKGMSEEDIKALSGLIHEDIMTLPLDKMTIKDPDELYARLLDMRGRIKDEVFEDDMVITPLGKTDVSHWFDQDHLLEDIKHRESELQGHKAKLEVYHAHEEKLAELDDLRKKAKSLSKTQHRFATYLELKKQEEKFVLDRDDLAAQLESLGQRQKQMDSAVQGLRDQEQDLRHELDEITDHARYLKLDYQTFEEELQASIPDLDLSKVTESKSEVLDVEQLISDLGHFRHRLIELRGNQSDIGHQKERIMREAGLIFDTETDWKRYLEANSDITAASQRLDKEWRTFISLAKNDFRLLVECVDCVDKLLQKISRTLNAHQISNLSGVEIAMGHHPSYQEAREFALDNDDLFADKRKRELYSARLQNFFSGRHTDLRAEDLFFLTIKINNPSNPSEQKSITSFENESEGTNYTLKAILLSELLHEQFSHGKYSNRVCFHYYLDEIGQLDDDNLSNIVSENLKKRLIPITAAPRPVIDPLCHPECRVVSLRFDADLKRTVAHEGRTFSVARLDGEK